MFNKDKFMSFYKGTINEKAASQCFDAVCSALNSLGIYSELTMIGAMATIRTEVGKGFKPIEEISSGVQYEGRADLGNTQAGDGPKYKGRGYIQLTGRYNYTAFGDKIGEDLTAYPVLCLSVRVSAAVLAQYFKERKINLYCEAQNWAQVRRLINGGTNGLDTFLNIINQYKA